MTPAGWITLLLVCGFIWGGALTLVTLAMRKEGSKPRADPGAEGR